MGSKRIRKTGQVSFIPRTNPEARDEGPRLLPLDPPKNGKTFGMERYLMLADIALGQGKNGNGRSLRNGRH
jgi:hypothetical protein